MAKKPEEHYSIIDTGLFFDGTLSAKGKILIKGTIKGNLDGEFVTIGPEGVVQANTKAATLTISGSFEGEAEITEKLIVLSKGSCEGKIVCRDLVVEPGGILNGQVTRLAAVEPEPKPSSNPFKIKRRKKK